MKIGIITILKTNNYGADLQAFALYKKLEKSGYSAEIIDYLYFKNPGHLTTKRSRPIANFSTKSRLKEALLYRVANPLIEKILPLFNSTQKKRIENFSAFLAKVKFSPTYRSLDSLYTNKPEYDVTIVGSDQVWNPGTGSSIEPYFLTFAKEDSLKISYASSFGTDKIDRSLYPTYKKWFENLDYVSVREKQGAQLIDEIAGKKAVQVLDPTLLLNKSEWLEFQRPYPTGSKNFILIYQLSSSETLLKIAYALQKKTGWPIVRICKRAFKEEQNEGILNIQDAGPGEFIHLFANASFVLTNSFHGTAFSLNFNLPFYTILSQKKSNNSRMQSLLEMVNLNDRIVWEGADLEHLDFNKPIDTGYVQERLTLEREKSVTFLTNHIEVASTTLS